MIPIPKKRVFALDLPVRIRANIICFQWRVSYVWSVEMKHPCDSESYKGLCVRMKGLEPPRPKTLDPKSNAATNYATCAVFGCKVSAIILFLQIYFLVRNIVGSRRRNLSCIFGELNEKLLILWVNSPDLLRFVVRRGANLLDYE